MARCYHPNVRSCTWYHTQRTTPSAPPSPNIHTYTTNYHSQTCTHVATLNTLPNYYCYYIQTQRFEYICDTTKIFTANLHVPYQIPETRYHHALQYTSPFLPVQVLEIPRPSLKNPKQSSHFTVPASRRDVFLMIFPPLATSNNTHPSLSLCSTASGDQLIIPPESLVLGDLHLAFAQKFFDFRPFAVSIH